MAIDFNRIAPAEQAEQTAQSAIDDLLGSTPAQAGTRIVYPGERMMEIRRENLEKGIPVDDTVWRQILELD